MAEEDALLREVEEELRRERLEKLWKRYGNLFLALSVGLVLAVAGYKGWQYYQRQQAEAAGKAYVEALDLVHAGKTEAAEAALRKLMEGRHAGAAGLARLRLAAMLAKQGKTREALDLYAQASADESLSLPYRNAARVRQAWLMVDTASREELAKLLGGLDVAGNPWRTAAREILALAALREGDGKTATKYLEQILSDPETPPDARSRANVLLNAIGKASAAKETAGR